MADAQVVLDDSAFEKGLAEACDDLKTDARGKLFLQAEEIAERARSIARRGPDPTEHNEPHMADTIEVKQKSKNVTEIRVKSRHAVFNEFGTSKMRPRPFLRPAIEEQRPV